MQKNVKYIHTHTHTHTHTYVTISTVIVQSLSRVLVFVTPQTGSSVLHYLLEFAQIHAH